MTNEKLSVWRIVCALLDDARTGSARPIGPSPDLRWRVLRNDAAEWAGALTDQETFTVSPREWNGLVGSIRDVIADGLEPVDAALAAAWGIDDMCWPVFTLQWLATHEEVFTLDKGEFFPVDDAQWPGRGNSVTSRPANLGVRAGELPHVRVHDISAVTIEWDTRNRITLTAALESTWAMGGVLPASVDDGDDAFRTGTWSPVVRHRALDLFLATVKNANVIVLPELSTDEDLIAALQEHTPPDVLVVGGSRVTEVDGCRVNRAPWWVGEMRLEHEKFAPARNEVDEWGLQPTPPRLTVALAHGWRVTVLICKDLLAPDVVAELTRAGVNLVLVPAWTERTEAFEAATAFLSVYSQAVTVIVFGPEPNAPVGLIGRPLRGCLALAVDGERPGYWLADLDSSRTKYFAGT